MVTLDKISEFLTGFAPLEYAESYDNVGLLIGDGKKSVERVLITLDTDEAVAKEAKDKKCDLIISHHPLIFKPLSKITTDESTSKTVISLIKNDVALFAMHTNFDSVSSGLCDLFMSKIAETKERVAIEGDLQNGCGRIAELKEITRLSDIINKVKKEYNLTNVRYIGDLDKKISKMAVCNGGGAEFVYSAKAMGAQVYISGDIKYNQARFAYENDIALIEVPHYNAEIIFCEYMKELLIKQFGNDLEFLVTDKNTDVWKSI